MKLLITGGAGFIGSELVRQAVSAGHEVLNFDALTYAANLDNLLSVSKSPVYKFFLGNICDPQDIDVAITAFKPDALIHLAAETHVDKSIDGASAFIKTNTLGTQVLLDAARQYWETLPTQQKDSFRFLHVSTDEVYGDLGNDDPAFCETTPYAPSSPYAASKASADHLVRAWHRTYGLPVLITNCSNNYGPYQFPEKLIPLVIIKALAGEDIPIYGSGENIRDWLYVGDHAHALLEVLEKGIIGQTYNIGGENERANIGLVKDICVLLDGLVPRNHASYQEQINFIKDRPGHDRRYAMNITKIKNDLGWSPQTKADAGVAQTVKWYIDNQDWWQKILDKSAATRRQGLTPK